MPLSGLQQKKLCNDVEAVRLFTYLGDGVTMCGGCEAAVTAKTKRGLVKFRECGRRFLLRLKTFVFKRPMKAAIMTWSSTWVREENKIGILQTKRSMV